MNSSPPTITITLERFENGYAIFNCEDGYQVIVPAHCVPQMAAGSTISLTLTPGVPSANTQALRATEILNAILKVPIA